MTGPEFKAEMNRLVEQYGEKSYSKARIELIWREVKGLEARTWKKVCDALIGSCEFAPLIPKITETVSIIREQEWNREKSKKALTFDEHWHASKRS
jgi:hypothetical protein